MAPENAQKAQLARNLGGDQTPALFFGASHGMGFPLGDSRHFGRLSHMHLLNHPEVYEQMRRWLR